MLAAAKQLQEFPSRVGDWKLKDDVPMADVILRTLQCAGHVNRVYVHQGTGQEVHVAVIVGPPGPTAVHTPEICYSSKAFEITDERERAVIGGAGAQANTLWKAMFKSRNIGAEPMCVYYAWSLGDKWVASRSPRYEFGGSRLLYKIQLAGSAGAPGGSQLEDPCRDFLESLLRANWTLAAAQRPPLNTEDSQ